MAFLLGCIAIILWGLLALFTVYTDGVPVFQLTAMTFFIASGIGFLYSLCRHGKSVFKVIVNAPLIVIIVSVCGLFGYHLFYFIALKHSPPESASLIAYLWPLLIVLMSALLPEGSLTKWHIIGAILGLFGCVLLVTKGQGFSLDSQYSLGYLAALLCAFIWSSYSVLSRKFSSVKSEVVTLYCFLTAILAYMFHLNTEVTQWHLSQQQWLGIIGLGIGPVGAAFFCWDVAMKHGPIKLLGVMSYFAPLISTLVLALFSPVKITLMIWLGCICIMLGAFLSAKEFWCKN